ncbi:hypothetical protein MBRA_04140 [Methylobacterium brachiatum]|nr:hypothetical protein MBRA_04140 [Methylobacterium brachiatum]
MSPKKRHRKLERKSTETRNQAVFEFDQALALGMSAIEASSKIKAPLSSIYRWRSHLDRSKIQGAKDSVRRKINLSISVLSNTESHNQFEQLEAAFTILIWHRWPTVQQNFDYAMMVCVVTYFILVYRVNKISELPDECSQFVLKHLRLDILSKICSVSAFELPIFELHNNAEHPYNDMDLAADIAWFFLSYQPNENNPRLNASLSKAHFASQNGIFRYNSRNAPSSFRKKWHAYGAASPFYYVERYHQGVEFFIDPSSPVFHEEIDELLSDPLRLRIHLGKCLSVVELLRVKLDPRALSAIPFPNFPPGLEPVPVSPPPLPIETNGILKGYTKLQNSFKDSELEDI